MLKTFLADRKISIYSLAKESGIPYSTLNDLANYKLPVENLRSGQLKALSEALGMTMDDAYMICSFRMKVHSQKYRTIADVIVKQKHYCLAFDRNGIHYEDVIIPVKQEATQNIQVLAEWKLEENLAKLIMEEAYESLSIKAER